MLVGMRGLALIDARRCRRDRNAARAAAPRPSAAAEFAEIGDDVARDRDRVAVAFRQMIGDAADAAVHFAAAERLHVDFFLGRGVNQLRTAEEHRALIADDHGLVAQRRHIGAAGGRRPVHGGDLRDAFARHPDLIVEDRAELSLVGEDIGLVRQVGAAGLHHGDAGQAMLPGESLRADMLLAGDAVIGAALYRRVIGDDHAGAARHHADPGDDAAARRHALVHAFAGELAEFEERRAGIKQRGDPLARQQLLALLVQPARSFRAAQHRGGAARMEIGNSAGIRGAVATEFVAGRRYIATSSRPSRGDL